MSHGMHVAVAVGRLIAYGAVLFKQYADTWLAGRVAGTVGVCGEVREVAVEASSGDAMGTQVHAVQVPVHGAQVQRFRYRPQASQRDLIPATPTLNLPPTSILLPTPTPMQRTEAARVSFCTFSFF